VNERPCCRSCECREQYHYGVPEPEFTAADLARLLERFLLERTGDRTFEEVADAQLQTLAARIAALTDVLRDAEPSQTVNLASRILLGDLTAVAAHFRGRANAMQSMLEQALADPRDERHESTDGQRD
jgi:hypothetical protein